MPQCLNININGNIQNQKPSSQNGLTGKIDKMEKDIQVEVAEIVY